MATRPECPASSDHVGSKASRLSGHGLSSRASSSRSPLRAKRTVVWSMTRNCIWNGMSSQMVTVAVLPSPIVPRGRLHPRPRHGGRGALASAGCTVEVASRRACADARWRAPLSVAGRCPGRRVSPRGVAELGHWLWPGLLCGPLVLADKAAEDAPALDALTGQVRDRVIWLGRAEVAAAMGSPSVVAGPGIHQDRLAGAEERPR